LRERRGAHMSKPKLLGLGLLSVGGVVGFIVGGGPAGIVFAAVCLIVGLVLIARSVATGTGPASSDARTTHPAHLQTRVLVLLKDVHARPQRGGKLQEIRDPNESDLEFEVFANCWLVSETKLPLRIIEGPQLTLKASDGSTRVGERITGDLENWTLGDLVKDKWDTGIFRLDQERISELNTTEPLVCGLPREGWLHFRIRNVSPSEFRAGTMELSIKDSLSSTHVGIASESLHLPGKIWPSLAKGVSAGRNGGAAPGL